VPAADRLREAEATVKAGGIDEGAWTKYRESGGTAKAIAERIWLDELAIPDVDPATLSGRDKVTAKRLEMALVARVEQSLVRHFRALTTEVGTTVGATRVRDQGDRIAGTTPGWSSRDIVGVVGVPIVSVQETSIRGSTGKAVGKNEGYILRLSGT
jgi:hypothetical protein